MDNGKLIARVFASKTNLAPRDEHAFFDGPPFFATSYDEVHVSCTFTWDKPWAEELKKQWGIVCKRVLVGGPAYGSPAGEFTPDLFIGNGGVITSRGCPHQCEHCLVPEREGSLRQLRIHEGCNVLDNNLLACSRNHIEGVMAMLRQQKAAALFTGGLEAARISDWVVDQLRSIKLDRLFLAYDRDGQEKALARALGKLSKYFNKRKLKCYVLVGHEGDTLQKAEARCIRAWEMGALPFAMFYRDAEGQNVKTPDWSEFQVIWTRPNATFRRAAMLGLEGGVKGSEETQLEFVHVNNREVPRRFSKVIGKLDGTATRAKAAKDGPAMDTVESWKKLIDELPPALVSIDARWKALERSCFAGHMDAILEGSVIPFNYTTANDTPWWWPLKLARANYHEAPSKWLWLGKRKPWWFRRWFGE